MNSKCGKAIKFPKSCWVSLNSLTFLKSFSFTDIRCLCFHIKTWRVSMSPVKPPFNRKNYFYHMFARMWLICMSLSHPPSMQPVNTALFSTFPPVNLKPPTSTQLMAPFSVVWKYPHADVPKLYKTHNFPHKTVDQCMVHNYGYHQ